MLCLDGCHSLYNFSSSKFYSSDEAEVWQSRAVHDNIFFVLLLFYANEWEERGPWREATRQFAFQ